MYRLQILLENEGCAIKDKMEIIFKDDYDVLIIASPIYMYNVTSATFLQ